METGYSFQFQLPVSEQWNHHPRSLPTSQSRPKWRISLGEALLMSTILHLSCQLQVLNCATFRPKNLKFSETRSTGDVHHQQKTIAFPMKNMPKVGELSSPRRSCLEIGGPAKAPTPSGAPPCFWPWWIKQMAVSWNRLVSARPPNRESGWWLTYVDLPLPLWKIWVRQMGWLFPIYGKIYN